MKKEQNVGPFSRTFEALSGVSFIHARERGEDDKKKQRVRARARELLLLRFVFVFVLLLYTHKHARIVSLACVVVRISLKFLPEI